MRKSLILILVVLNVGISLAQNVQLVSMPKYLANSIYSFTRFVNWPNESKSGDFVITVISNKPVFDELQTLTAGKSVGMQPIKVLHLRSVDELTDYSHIVFLGGSVGVPIRKLVQKTFGHKNLLITECEGMTQGVRKLIL
jgi:hypothetical protein